MPTYVYKREDGTTFEIQQKMTDPVLETCPTTGQPVKRMIGAGAGLIFKGEGFYITDYARKGKPGEGKSDEGKTEAAPEASKAESAEGAKPAAKPAAKASDTGSTSGKGD